MELELAFGEGVQRVSINADNLIKIILPNQAEPPQSEEQEIIRALTHPIGTGRLRDIVRQGERVAIITSDITRPMPTARVMPLLLNELNSAGVRDGDITLLYALGSHRRHTPEEKRRLAGEEVYSRISCIDADAEDCVHIGTTTMGTPVDIARCAAEADRRICLGNIEYHYFAGYSGGAKAIMPGISTKAAIQHNHSRMVESGACAGKLDANPVREDIEEAAAMVGVDFILNVVLDEHKRIVHACAGDMTLAHREGCRCLDKLYSVLIPQKADIVIVSQGGAPKDLNLYQSQKALENAKYAVKDGGVIILMGACGEGFGERVFEQWLTQAVSPHALIEKVQREFVLGGHKAAAIAMVLERASIFLVSEMESSVVRSIFMEPYGCVQEAFDAAMERCGAGARVIVMPYGGSTLPVII